MKRFLGLCCLLTALFTSGQVLAAELVLSAAASLSEVMDSLKQAYQAENPGVKVVSNYAAQGTLLKQIVEGAPVDLFVCADMQTMDKAEQSKLILPDTRKILAANQLWLVAKADSELAIEDMARLMNPKVERVALGNPETTAIGKYVKQKLTALGLWDKLASKLVLGETVRQVLRYLSQGEVDAAFLFASELPLSPVALKKLCDVAGPENFIYPAAVVAHTRQPDLARDFLEFLAGPKAREVFAAKGFTVK